MTKYNVVRVKIPDVNQAYVAGNLNYSNPTYKQQNIKMLNSIYSQYKSSIDNWASVFETGIELIIAFIATESSGKNAPPNKFKATGLMQMTPPALFDTIKKWKSEVDSDIPPEVMSKIRLKIPEIISSKTLTSTLEAKILRLLQSDSDFNIMTGTMLIRWLLERFSSSVFGSQLNKTLVAYNAGAYRSVLNSAPVLDTAMLVKNTQVPLESRGYLLKMLGKDGFLQLMVVDKKLIK